MDAEELRKRTKDFAIRVVRLARALPRSLDGQVLGRQQLRSATSAAANYRSACRARSRAEFCAKLSIAVEEIDESVFWLDVIADTALVRKERLGVLLQEANELTAILASARRTMRTKDRGKE